jgi:hypothetical protein
MGNAEKLFLVRPEQQAEPDANLRNIVNYIASPGVLFSKVAEEYTSALLHSNLDNLIEIWYWFDSLNVVHRIVFWGDDLESPDAILRAENYDPCAEHPYYWFPLVLYDAFIDQDLPGGDGALTKWNAAFWNSPRSHLSHLIEHGYSLHSEARLSPDTVSEIAANDESSSAPPPSGEGWDATLMLVEYTNRIPAIPAPKAARLLGVTEKTIRNQCGKGLECLPRKGTTWVTKRSIQSFLQERYHPTPAFNLWNDIEDALKRNQTDAAVKQQQQQDYLDRRKKTGKRL